MTLFDMMRCIQLPVALAAFTFGQVTPAHIGQHQIGETIQQWSELEPQAWASYSDARLKTDITPHRLRETFSEWLKLNQLDLNYICGKRNRGDNSMDFKAVCKKFSAMQDSGNGDFYTTDQTGRTFGWRFVNGTLAEYSIDDKWKNAIVVPDLTNGQDHELLTTSNNRAYKWQFVDSKLSAVSVTPDWSAIYKTSSEEGIARHPEIVPAFQEEVDFLVQVYGKPSTAKSVPYHNAYGAHWERSELTWHAPDGTQIVAFERTGFNQQGQLELVTFHSRESLEKEKRTKPNPYK